MSANSLLDVKGIGPSILKRLNSAKIYTLEDLIKYSAEDLVKIEGIGYKSAVKWLSEVNFLLNEGQEPPIKRNTLIKSTIRESENSIKEVQNDIRHILNKLINIEERLSKLEKGYPKNKINGEGMSTSILEYPFIRNDDQLYEIIKEKIKDMKKGQLGIKQVSIEELYYEIVKDYSITKEIFTEYLLMLFNKKRVILDPDITEQGLSISENEGNIFKFVRILE